jgi:hypothetical protein
MIIASELDVLFLIIRSVLLFSSEALMVISQRVLRYNHDVPDLGPERDVELFLSSPVLLFCG